LAEDSKQAAVDIQKLTRQTVEITQSTALIAEELKEDIQLSEQLSGQISRASHEQTLGTDQMGYAIQQLNQVSQQNAASSEELASSAEELASQADSLKEIIQYFKIN